MGPVDGVKREGASTVTGLRSSDPPPNVEETTEEAPMSDLPRASTVLATLRSVVGTAGVIQMRDYGHGLGAVHVTLPHWLTPALSELSVSDDWDYVGPTESGQDDVASPSCMEFSRWVRLT